ncbi:GTP-binding protein [Arthrobacter mangrovi]|nr:GTP-binding protein [Arthrobacter mangrovi]
MPVILISSLDPFCRQAACDALGSSGPDDTVVLHDLLESGTVLRRIYRGARMVEREETPLEHGCLSCTVRLDVVPTVRRLLEEGLDRLVLGLPPSVPAETVVYAFGHTPGPLPDFASVVLACAPANLEDQLWDGHSLFESGYSPTAEDDRRPGEFLVRELAFCDTLHFSDPPIGAAAPAHHTRGTKLAAEVAPHAAVVRGKEDQPGRFDLREARARSHPGSVRVPASDANAPYRTIVLRAARPLHPGRFRLALAELASGNCWLRGRVWLASSPASRVALCGAGPRIWLEDTGPWLADKPGIDAASAAALSTDAALDWRDEHGDRGTVLALTGIEVDAVAGTRLLQHCQLTEAELARVPALRADPFGLPALTDPGSAGTPAGQ